MIKPVMILSLLLAIPATTDNTKPPTKQEMIQLRNTVKNLEELTAEQQDRLQAHRLESNSLNARIATLESRIAALETDVRSSRSD
jgi:septal ring factor EnvC (AmiA/AmiB activator)